MLLCRLVYTLKAKCVLIFAKLHDFVMAYLYLVVNRSYPFGLILAKSTSLEVDYTINPFYL